MTESQAPKLTPEQISNIYGNHSAEMLHDEGSIGEQQLESDDISYADNRERTKKTNYLIRLGSSVRVVGWFYLFMFPILAFLLGWTGNYKLIPWYLIFVVPFCAFYIFSGKYIMFNGGKAMPVLLIIYTILGLITLPTVLSGIIGLQSLIGYIYYKKLQKRELLTEINPVAAQPKIITIVILLIVVGSGCYALTYKNPLNPMFGRIEQISDLSNNRIYSRKYKFSIQMPFKTTTSNDVSILGFANMIPYTVYESGTDRLAYIVVVHDYSSFKSGWGKASALDYEFVNTVTLLDGKLLKKETTSFKKLTAISGEFTAPDTNTKEISKCYYKAFVKDNYIYEVYSMGLDKNNFNKFIASFQFE